MSTINEPEGRSPVVDGDVAVILRTVQNFTNIELFALNKTVAKHLPSDDSFNVLYQNVLDLGLIANSPIGVSLTEKGMEWLDSENNALSIEQENVQSDDGPKVPYDVAKLNMETRNLSVFQALRKIDLNQINLNPEFQRAFVWDIVRQSRLIESILIRIPLPAFYLDATDQINWNVVDGLQRLTTLHNYCRKTSFKLTGLQFLTDELEGKTFQDLPPKYKVLIEDDTQLLFYNLMPGTPVQAKFTIFSRVNTGGMQLTAQEIRHALNQGKVTEMLGKIAKSDIFRSVTKGVVETLRMGDRELILRVIAFIHLGFEEYRKFNELDAFLVHAMVELNRVEDTKLEELSSVFLDSLIKMDLLFGKYAFRKFYAINGRRSPFNKALFEVWTTTIAKFDFDRILARRDYLFEKFTEMNSYSEAFSRSISSSTGSFTAVATRFDFIESLLKDVTQ